MKSHQNKTDCRNACQRPLRFSRKKEKKKKSPTSHSFRHTNTTLGFKLVKKKNYKIFKRSFFPLKDAVLEETSITIARP